MHKTKLTKRQHKISNFAKSKLKTCLMVSFSGMQLSPFDSFQCQK